MISEPIPSLAAETARRSLSGSLPVYPALFFVAWILTLFSNSPASLHALGRPVLVGILIVVLVQLGISGIAKNRHLGAILVMVLFTSIVGLPILALVLCAVLISLAAFGIVKRRSVSSLPWASLTELLNVVAALTVVYALVVGAAGGYLTPTIGGDTIRGAANPALPDIYLVLLDGYPRSDTLASDFSFDNAPFLEHLRALGFDLSAKSHSNYNMTWLTLASMFNMAHIAELPEVADGGSASSQFRALGKAINRGRGLDEFRSAGYEIVSIPSGFSSAALYDADRLLDSGQLTDFEDEIVQQGALRALLPDLQNRWLLGQHRERITNTFDRLAEVASERADHPRFVFAHVLSPHPPPVFGPHGEPRDGWPCFPTLCSMWYGGQMYGREALGPILDQVQYINSEVEKAASEILQRSGRPPVIVFFSDHGSRKDFDDTDEMLRSFLVALTPDHPHLFPDDVTPVNIIPRLLNAYAGTHLPLASEQSYWIDQRKMDSHPLDLIPWEVVHAP